MKTQIEKMRGEIGTLMQGFLVKREFGSVTQLSPYLARLESLDKRVRELEGEISDIEASIKSWSGKTLPCKDAHVSLEFVQTNGDSDDCGRAAPQTLRIDVDWKANGRDHEKELILAPNAADVLVKFLGRVTEELGQDALQKLSRIKINRGPLLSKVPNVEFMNQAQGKIYSHKRLPGTEYYVLTHSETPQKADDINRVCRVLGLSPGSVQVHVVSRADCYAEIYN
jgi:hypothetical protein